MTCNCSPEVLDKMRKAFGEDTKACACYNIMSPERAFNIFPMMVESSGPEQVFWVLAYFFRGGNY